MLILQYIAKIADLALLVFLYYVWRGFKYISFGKRLSFQEWTSVIKREVYEFLGGYAQAALIIGLIAMLCSNAAVHQIVGIHNLKLKPEGTYGFYVEAIRDDGKTYTLPAQIRVEKEIDEVAEGKRRTFTYYYIEKVYFSNGGYLNTKGTDPIDVNESTYYYDGEDGWSLVLLNEHAYSPQIQETNNITAVSIVLLALRSISIAMLLYSLCKKE